MPRIVDADESSIREAARRLRGGEVVAFPTETVYGLGADTFQIEALRRVYELKGRPADNPLIAHVLNAEQARERLTDRWDDRCEALTAAFWPGPLTIVIDKAESVPAEATAGRATIAIRSPAHPAARALLGAFGGPISAPSANVSGHVSPTRAQHVADDFSKVDDLLILDGGTSDVGIESTVIDLTLAIPTILRPGSASVEAIRRVIGELAVQNVRVQSQSPGTSARHYAPRTRTILVFHGGATGFLQERAGGRVVSMTFQVLDDPSVTPLIVQQLVMPNDPAAYAARLYEALRYADTLGGEEILIERPPKDDPAWDAVIDRIERAAHR